MSIYTAAAALMIVSGSVHAVVNAIIKGRRQPEIISSIAPATSIMAARGAADGTSAILLVPAIWLVPLPVGAWGWLVISALVHIIYLYAMIRAYAASDFSAAYPVLRGTAPLATALLAVGIFGEPITLVQSAGIALIGAAMFLLLVGRHLSRSALGWAVVTGAMTASYTVADAHGVRASPSVASYIVWDFVAIGSLSVIMFALISRGTVFASMRRQWRSSTVAGVLSIVTYGLALTALSLGPTAPLAALRETGMLVALVIATTVLGETVTWQRIIASAGILGGAALVIMR